MPPTMIKRIAKSLMWRAGLDVRRMPEQRRREVDAFAAQSWLLRGQDVATIFDVGANVGQTTRIYRELFSGARIHSFEPFEEAYSELSGTFEGDQLVVPQKIALSNRVETRRLFVNAGAMTNSLLPSAAGAAELVGDGVMANVGTAEVATTTLDEFCRSNGIETIDILKMDIQGGELMALEGARGMLQRHAVQLIFTEVLFASLYENQAWFDDLARHLRSHGYMLFGLYGLIHPGGKSLAWGDAVFISPQLARQNHLTNT